MNDTDFFGGDFSLSVHSTIWRSVMPVFGFAMVSAVGWNWGFWWQRLNNGVSPEVLVWFVPTFVAVTFTGQLGLLKEIGK